MPASPARVCLFLVCLLCATSRDEEATDRCINDAICQQQEVTSSRKSLLQGRMAGSVTGTATEDVLTGTSAEVAIAAGAEPPHAWKNKKHVVVGEEIFASVNSSRTQSPEDEADGLPALMSALTGFGILIAVHIIVFVLLLPAVPMVYAYNVLAGEAPVKDTKDLGGCRWVSAGWRVTTEEAVKLIGLDCAMLLEFLSMSVRICTVIGVPMALIVAPMNALLGGGDEDDPLRKGDEKNIKVGHWLYWRESFIVWFVVLVVHHFQHQSHEKFRQLRSEWLQQMSPPQSRTILIQNLKEELDSDDALKRFMIKLFDAKAIESVFIVRAKDGANAPCTKNGFVTFRKRRDKEVALELQMDNSVKHDTNMVTGAPAPADVLYEVLQQEDANPVKKSLVGRILMGLLFAIYLPLIFLVALVTSLDTLGDWFPSFGKYCSGHQEFVNLWEGIVAPSALAMLPGFIPTFLMMIILGYFALPATSWCQSTLERWYFYFQVTFSLIIFSFSTTFFELYALLLTHPKRVLDEIFPMFQSVSFFYLVYIPADICTHTSALWRIVQLLKFLWYKRSNDPEEAHHLAEPEDQDYQGIGARSARVVLILVIVLVYCTIETYISLLGLLDFVFCRVIYGYLMVFAETRKPDSGGQIWLASIKQVQLGLFLYVALMTSIIFTNCSSDYYHAPGYVAILAFALIYKFDHDHRELERLTIEEVVDLDAAGAQSKPSGVYAQPQPDEEAKSS